MRRVSISLVLAAALVAMPMTVLAAPKSGCPNASSGWQRVSPTQAATLFFSHLLPGQFTNIADFAAEIDAIFDKDGDDWVCIRLAWGYDLNPNAHWYRVGLEVLGEPVHTMSVKDTTANAK